jgi:hypothetical protein
VFGDIVANSIMRGHPIALEFDGGKFSFTDEKAEIFLGIRSSLRRFRQRYISLLLIGRMRGRREGVDVDGERSTARPIKRG